MHIVPSFRTAPSHLPFMSYCGACSLSLLSALSCSIATHKQLCLTNSFQPMVGFAACLCCIILCIRFSLSLDS